MSKDAVKEAVLTCPHCGETDRVFQNGAPVLNTDGIQMIAFWCDACRMPWHIFKKNGKVVERDEF